MGNSYCCSSKVYREQILSKPDISLEPIIKFEKLDEKVKNENKSNKTITTFSSKKDESFDFINPLPEIVIIKFKKNIHKNLL